MRGLGRLFVGEKNDVSIWVIGQVAEPIDWVL